MSDWGNIDKLEGQGRRRLPYMTPGRWHLRVSKVAKVESQQPHKRGTKYFLAEFEVISGPSDNAVSDVCWLSDLSLGELSLRDIKSFAQAVLGAETLIDGPTMDKMVGVEQPAAGFEVRAVAEDIETKSGNTFTKVYWYALEQPPF